MIVADMARTVLQKEMQNCLLGRPQVGVQVQLCQSRLASWLYQGRPGKWEIFDLGRYKAMVYTKVPVEKHPRIRPLQRSGQRGSELRQGDRFLLRW